MWLHVHALPHEAPSRQTVYGECTQCSTCMCAIEEDWAMDVHKQDTCIYTYMNKSREPMLCWGDWECGYHMSCTWNTEVFIVTQLGSP